MEGGVAEVKARLNIADVVRRYVDLKSVSGRWVGLCPFHQEKTASFSVNEDEGFFYCFGCQAAGDVLEFYMRINGLEFRDALEQLAIEAGVELTQMAPDPHASERKAKHKLLVELHDVANEWFQHMLKQGAGRETRQYLKNRGMTPEIIEKFGLGFSPDDWHGLDGYVQSKGYKSEDAVEAGLLSQNQKGNIYDRFRGRLIFPIQNLSGQVIAFGGRILTKGEPKYLNSSDTPIYKKGEHLYGLNVARPTINHTKQAILTEGYMDVLSLHQFGYTQACGVLGTALTQEQVRRLVGFCSSIDLIFDGDSAGHKAALKSSRMILQHGTSCRVVLMPDGEDVDSILQKYGVDGLEQYRSQAPSGLDFCTQTIKQNFSPKEMVRWAEGFLGDLTDSSLRAFYLPRVAEGLGMSEMELRQNVTSPVTPISMSASKAQKMGQVVEFPIPTTGPENRNDDYFIKFAIQYSGYIPHLDEIGLGIVLKTQHAKVFWKKLVHGHLQGEFVSLLDNREKVFYIKCRTELTDNVLLEEELEAEWNYIVNELHEQKKKIHTECLIEALRQAQISGDAVKIGECALMYQNFLQEE